MLSDNIKKYRKANNMSQDELAQRLNVTRQSVSLWENGQSQPTIDNIIALTKIFGISSDELLDTSVAVKDGTVPKEEAAEDKDSKPKSKTAGIIIAAAAVVVIALVIILCTLPNRKDKVAAPDATVQDTAPAQEAEDTAEALPAADLQEAPVTQEAEEDGSSDASVLPQVSDAELFGCCKDFAIQKGSLNGDYCIYQQPSSLYGGYADEYFSISYWGDSDMVEFCLHCPIDDTMSINFYLRMRGGYDGTYEYLSSKYYRSDGSSLRSASGHIDPSVFSAQYPLNCDSYVGESDGQDDFMEESRVGMCDLIKCLKQFAEVEDMQCDFGFVNF